MTRIGFSTPRRFNPVSWLVRKLTGSQASHAFFIYRDKDWDTDMVLEAHEFGFRLMTLELFEKHNRLVADISPLVNIDRGLKVVAVRYLGTIYDFPGLVGVMVMLLGRWLRRKWRNPFNSAKAVFCSESVVIALQTVDYPGASRLVPHDTTPQDLLEFLRQAE